MHQEFRESFLAYTLREGVHWSSLKEMARSPAHYRYALTHPREETDAMVLGRACHTACLEPMRFLRDYVLWEGGRRAGKEWEEFLVRSGDRTPLRPQDLELATGMQAAIEAHPAARELLRGPGSTAETVIAWDDGGTLCKARLDILNQPEHYIVDLKSTSDLSRFETQAASMKYHGQLAFYHRAARALTGKHFEAFIVAVESKPPHDVGVWQLSEETLALGRELTSDLLRKLRECTESDTWPGSRPDVKEWTLPDWALPGADDESEAIDWSA
jgi:exodeoxyribonuclease VIII